jgi:two-component system OmpR family sensor kinase
MKIRTQITLWFSILVTILTIISGVFSYIGIKRDLDESLIKEIRNKANEVQNVIYFLAKEYQKKGAPLRIEDPEVFLYILSENQGSLEHGVYLQLTKGGRIIARSPNLTSSYLPLLPEDTMAAFELKQRGQAAVNVFYYSTYVEFAGIRIATLQIAIPMTKNEEFLNQLFFYDLLEVIFVFVFSVFLGQFLSYKAFSPVSRITAEVESMEIKDFSKRLDTSQLSNDEIGKLALTFNLLLERIANSIKIQNRFIADASHELRSPLTAIIGHAELLEKRGEKNPDVLKNSSNVIIREGQRLMKLVNDLLFLARSGVKKPDRQKINLDELLVETISSLFPFNSQISITIPKEDVFVEGEPDSLKRIIINLVNNALAAIDENGTVSVKLEKQNDNAKIMISDNGSGIEQEHLNHLFERFYRVDKSRERSKGGSGLGLSIVFEIIKQHNGNIEVESEPGRGSVFTVSLPLTGTETVNT